MIIVRADAGPEIGAGHVMRCLSVSDALRRKGEEIVFVSANEFAKKIVNDRGYECIVLKTDYGEMEKEIDLFKKTNVYKESKAIIVDSYYATAYYLTEIKGSKKLIFFDDYMKDDYPIDVLINYNIFADETKYSEIYKKVDALPKFILGPYFAPLRESFYDCSSIDIRKNVRDIMILTGGSDPLHLATELAREITKRGIKEYAFHFVCGSLSDCAKELKEYEKNNEAITVHLDVKDIKSLMLTCDMAVSAAGSTLYELCACGIPTIVFSMAENQQPAVRAFSGRGIMLSMGKVTKTDDFCDGVLSSITALASDFNRRKEMSSEGKKVTDGNGALKLADMLLSLYI